MKITDSDIFNLLTSKKIRYLELILLLFLDIFCILQQYITYSLLIFGLIVGILVSFFSFPLNFQYSTMWSSSKRNITILLIIYVICYTFSIIYLWYFEALYSKSFIYYFLIGVCASLIFLVTFSECGSCTNLFAPLMVVFLGFNIFLSDFVTFQNGLYASGDTHSQIYRMLIPIVQNGVIPTNELYSFYPIHVICVYIISSITNLDPIKLYLYANGIIYPLISLFLYSLSAHLFNKKVGILSMLFFITAPNIVYHATHAYQFSYSFPLSVVILFVILLSVYYRYENNVVQQKMLSFAILLILLMSTIVFTHHFTSIVVVILILILYFVSVICLREATKVKFLRNTLLLYLALLFFHWLYFSSTLSLLVTVIDVYINSLFTPENYQYVILDSSISNYRNFSLIFLDSVGTSLLFLVGTIGFHYGLLQKNKYVLIIAFWGAFIWGLASVGSFIKMPLLLGGRLLTFVWGLSLVFLASLGIVVIVNKKRLLGLVCCCLLILIISISNLGNTVSGPETSLFIGNQPYIKLYDTQSDLEAYMWIKQNIPDNSHIKVAESWVPQYMDTNRIYDELPFDILNNLDTTQIENNSYILLTDSYSSGIHIRGISEADQLSLVTSNQKTPAVAEDLHVRLLKIEYSELLIKTYGFDSIYSNGRGYIKRN